MQLEVEIRICPDDGYVEWVWTGPVDAPRLMEGVRRARSLTGWSPSLHHLQTYTTRADLSGLDLPGLSQMRAAFRRWQEQHVETERVKQAHVTLTPPNPGIGPLWTRLAQDGAYSAVAAFDNREDALTWLLSD